MDLVRVETKSQVIFIFRFPPIFPIETNPFRMICSEQILFSFLSIGWGLISDIDIESERLRSFGYQRFAIWSVHRLINLRTYHGTLSYLPVTSRIRTNAEKDGAKYETNGMSMLRHSMSCNMTLDDCPDCHGDGDCETCDTAFGDVLALETNGNFIGQTNNNAAAPHRPRLDSWYSADSRKSAYFSTSESIYQSVGDRNSSYGSDYGEPNKYPAQMYGPAPTVPALTAPVPTNWTSETGDFIMVHAAYQTHIGSDCMFAPSSQLNDGIIWLLVIRGGASRQELFKFLLSLSSGTHIPVAQNDFIQMIPVTAFRIEPSAAQGHFTVDGERVEYGPIQCEIFPGISKVLIPKYT